MERGFPMKRHQLVALLLMQIAATSVVGATRSLVLVCRHGAVVCALTAEDARKVFLGAPVMVAGKRVKALRNLSDAHLDEVFLQKVVFLSGPAYERQVLSRVFRLGGQKPAVYDAVPELLSALRESPAAVTYMWTESLDEYGDLQVIATFVTGEVK
jgi:hypothetical protein